MSPADAAPRVLLIHNAGADTSSWDRVIAALPPEWECQPIPLAGHRHSSRPGHRLHDHRDVVLDALNVGPPAIVVGHCVGGAAALSAARVAPERVHHLLLLSPATLATLNAGPWGRLRHTLARSPTHHPLTRAVRAVLKTRAGRSVAAHTQVGPWLSRSPAVAHTAHQLASPATADRLALLLSDFADFAEGDEPWEIPQRPPISLVWGSRNRVLPIAGLTALQQSLRPTQVHVVAGAGHVLPLEVPEVVAGQIMMGENKPSPKSRSLQ